MPDILIIGYGKMGKAIEMAASRKGFAIAGKVDADNINNFPFHNFDGNKTIALEFTEPVSAPGNVIRCLDAGLPVVCGTTGWEKKLPETKEYCRKKKGKFLHASNFSIGVNIFFEVNKYLASLMKNRKEFDVFIAETHHIHKKDAPSGTAITLAKQLLKELPAKKKWVNHPAVTESQLAIFSERKGEVAGIHTVEYGSSLENIHITHEALSRDVFAEGAIMAADWLAGQKSGVFGMKDMLTFARL